MITNLNDYLDRDSNSFSKDNLMKAKIKNYMVDFIRICRIVELSNKQNNVITNDVIANRRKELGAKLKEKQALIALERVKGLIGELVILKSPTDI